MARTALHPGLARKCSGAYFQAKIAWIDHRCISKDGVGFPRPFHLLAKMKKGCQTKPSNP
eukprot:1159420-Pelagomonas_calceolata.AAC.17